MWWVLDLYVHPPIFLKMFPLMPKAIHKIEKAAKRGLSHLVNILVNFPYPSSSSFSFGINLNEAELMQ